MNKSTPQPKSHGSEKRESSDVVSRCQRVLEKAIHKEPATIFLSLSTLDGRSLAFASVNKAIKGQRVAAITSSLMSLSEAFGREVLRGQCRYSAISTNFGPIVTIRVPAKSRQFALSLCADRTENMAMALRVAMDAAEGLAEIIDQSQTTESLV